jgi:hypothetical protein
LCATTMLRSSCRTVHAVRFPVAGSYTAVMPRLRASTPVRRGVLWALRSRAAVDVLLSAGLPGLCVKRSGRGVFVDLMVRMLVRVMDGDVAVVDGRNGRMDEGSRKAGGSEPQLSGVFGGIVYVVVWMPGVVVTGAVSGDFRDGARAGLGWAREVAVHREARGARLSMAPLRAGVLLCQKRNRA